MGAHYFKLNKVPLYRLKTCEYQCFEVCCPKSSSCASKPLLTHTSKFVPSFGRIEIGSDGGP